MKVFQNRSTEGSFCFEAVKHLISSMNIIYIYFLEYLQKIKILRGGGGVNANLKKGTF